MTDNSYHIAIIMDGNRRWSYNRGFDIQRGYERGYQRLMDLISYALSSFPISNLTVFAFSKENMLRKEKDRTSVFFFVYPFINEIDKKSNELFFNVNFIGDLYNLPDSISSTIKSYNQRKSYQIHHKNLNIAFNYGGRNEMLSVVNSALSSGIDKVDMESIKSFFYFPCLPDVDFLIRTGGEKRLSNFLLWHISYAECFFLDVLWPDFTNKIFFDVYNRFLNRKRRFGLD